MICPYCGGGNTRKRGIRNDVQRYSCYTCEKWWSAPPYEKRRQRVLLFDIETAPMEVFVWHLGKQRIHHHNIIKGWNTLGWSAKWLCEKGVVSDILTPDEAIRRDDERIIKSVWKLLDEADVVIAHNAIGFDVRRLNTRFLYYDMPPPMPFQVIDTLQAARKHFAFASNKLDYLATLLENRGKLETNFDLWKGCLKGDEQSLKYMEKYNRMDVLLLEEVYLHLRPYIKSHPNMGIYSEADVEVCPSCSSENIDWKGYYVTPAGKYRSFRCECGAIGRSRFTALGKEERKKLTVSVAR